MKQRAVGALASLAVLAWAYPASATVMVEVPLEELARDADAIVHATVVSSGVRMALRGQGLTPETVTTLRVHTWLAGAGLAGEGGETVTLRELGGVWREGGLHYEGTPRYRPGEEVVVFLRRRPEAPNDLRTMGMVQGKFSVRHGVGGVPSRVHRDLDGVAFVHWADGQQTVRPPNAEPEMELRAFLSAILQMRAQGTTPPGGTGVVR